MATIDKRSKKSWRARVRVQGFEDKTRSFDTRAEAVEWANRVEAQLLAGVDTVPDLAAEMTLLRDTKNGTDRTIALSKDAFEIVDWLLKQHDEEHVFPVTRSAVTSA